MPWKSESQRKFLFSQKPKLAHKWSKKYGSPKNLPEKLSAKDNLMKRKGNK